MVSMVKVRFIIVWFAVLLGAYCCGAISLLSDAQQESDAQKRREEEEQKKREERRRHEEQRKMMEQAFLMKLEPSMPGIAEARLPPNIAARLIVDGFMKLFS